MSNVKKVNRKSSPLVSVILPVKNCAEYISETINSVLNQDFKDFELIIINDESTDRTLDIIEAYSDARIRVYNRKGLIQNLNFALKIAKGNFIARIDGDDIMYKSRLKLQYNLMNTNEDIAVCSSYVMKFSTTYHIPKSVNKNYFKGGYITNPLELMVKGNIIFHPSVMIRRDFLLNHRLSYQQYSFAEDYKLWVEIAKRGGKFFIIPKFLTKYRISNTQISSARSALMEITANKIKLELISYLISKSNKKKELRSVLTASKYLLRNHYTNIDDLTHLFYQLFYDDVK